MSVYLQDDMVLLDSDLVATSTDCCCGGCTDCDNFVDHGSTCTDIDGFCHPIQNCDGSCSGPITPCVDIFWMTDIAYCATTGEGCSIQSIKCITSIDPVTCEFTQVGDNCFGDCPEGQTTINSQSVERIQCMGACCLFGMCSITTLRECVDAGGDYHGTNSVCDPDPC